MRIIVIFLLSLLMVDAVCAGQRLSDIRPGDPCDEIVEIEKRLGSSESASNDAKGVSRYTGTHGGKEATIVYRCDEGLLDEQTIVVTTSTQDEAYRFANEQKAEISRRLGNPIHDGLELGTWRRLFFGFLGADLDYLVRVVVWGRAKEDPMLSVTEVGENRWEVSVSQGSSKTEYIFNS